MTSQKPTLRKQLPPLFNVTAEQDGEELVLRCRAFEWGALADIDSLESVRFIAIKRDGRRVQVDYSRIGKSSAGLPRRGL